MVKLINIYRIIHNGMTSFKKHYSKVSPKSAKCICCILICIVCIVAIFKLCCVQLLLVGRVYCFSCLVYVFLSYVYLLYYVGIVVFFLL